MAIKLSGMISGLDTDAMIDELVSAYSTKKDNIYKEQKTLSYKQDAWKELNSKVYKFYTGTLSSLRFASAYSKKAVSASNEGKVKVSADGKAVNGTQNLKITALAKSGYLTGAKLNGTINGNTKLSELGITESSRINVKINGEETYIDLNASTTIDQVVSKLKGAGVTASFDANNNRFFISSEKSGTEGDFSITGNDALGTETLKKLGLYSFSSTEAAGYKDYIDSVAADSEYMANLAKKEYLNTLLSNKLTEMNKANSELNSKVSDENKKIAFAKLSDKEKNKTVEELQKKINDATQILGSADSESEEYKKAQSSLEEYEKLMNTYTEIRETIGSSDDAGFKDSLKAYTDERQAVIDSYNEEITANKEVISDINKAMSGSISDMENYLGSDVYDYSSDEYNKTLEKYQDKLDYAKSMMEDYNRYQDAVEAGDTDLINQYEAQFGLASSADGAVRITGADAEIYLNGARFTSNSNAFNINGLTVTAMGLTEGDEEISITTSTDVSAIYDTIKSLFTDYNTLIKEMESKLNADSAGEYKPLTDDEMKDMTDKQIEKWEDKLTTAALRGDSTLSSVISAMKTVMNSTFDINGKSYSLATFGIKTAGYFASAENERGVFHIDGDSSDGTSSGNTDKLLAALTNDPDSTLEFFTKLTSSLYNKLTDKMSASSVSSAYTLYNDKYMKKQYSDYDSKLSDWEDKIDAMREKYENQFAAMEKALSNLNSQQSSLSSMLGS